MKFSGKAVIAGLAGAGLLAFGLHKLFKKSKDEEAEGVTCPEDEEDVEEVGDDE